MMETYQEAGSKGRLYYVFDGRKMKREDAIREAASDSKNAKRNMTIVPVWIKDDTLYTVRTRGARKMMAVTRVSRYVKA